MDLSNEIQPQVQPYDLNSLHPFPVMAVFDDFPNLILPCTGGIFHLLSCGHIVIINAPNQTCGANCQVAISNKSHSNIAYLLTATVNIGASLTACSLHMSQTTVPSIDNLYCETCQGLTFGRSQRILKTSRRSCTALTVKTLQAYTGVNTNQAYALLCRPFFNFEDGRVNAHRLCCGHEVWSRARRPCALNCGDSSLCRSAIESHYQRRHDAILCQECLARADLVHIRSQNLDDKMARNDPGQQAAGP
ncbi:hypothetical protein GQ44DRAFT_722582 [Phaeosphaeriaceae sp. PMI808]|nr:hypothetical protein GQ44DRAFT_722582 [Phaeosphaeriaceae sp. PMI808]